jgi:hypothetical protein
METFSIRKNDDTKRSASYDMAEGGFVVCSTIIPHTSDRSKQSSRLQEMRDERHEAALYLRLHLGALSSQRYQISREQQQT